MAVFGLNSGEAFRCGTDDEMKIARMKLIGDGALLIAGLWTPIAGSLVIGLAIWQTVRRHENPYPDILLAAVGVPVRSWVPERCPWMHGSTGGRESISGTERLPSHHRGCISLAIPQARQFPTRKRIATHTIQFNDDSIWGFARAAPGPQLIRCRTEIPDAGKLPRFLVALIVAIGYFD